MEEEKLLPQSEPTILAPAPITPAIPSVERQSWGVVISIIIIVLMIVVGAFYAWGQRIAKQNNIPAASGLQ